MPPALYIESEIEVISPTTTVEAIEKALDVPAIDPIVLSVANEYLSGKPITQIADIAGGSYPAFMNILLALFKAKLVSPNSKAMLFNALGPSNPSLNNKER